RSGWTNSSVASAAYTISIPNTVAAPTFSPAAGTYASAQTVTLSTATTGAAICYTTDGSTPTAGSTSYTGPIQVLASQTIRAIAVRSGWTNSSVASAAYTIGGSAAVVTRVPFAALPNHPTALTQDWSNGEPHVLQDRSPGSAGELFGFGWSDKLHIFKSADGGSHWTFVDTTESIASSEYGKRMLGIAQDSLGKVHLLFVNGTSGQVEYTRLALSHTSGAISGFASEVKGIALPGSFNTNGDVRGVLLDVMDQSGAETLVYSITDIGSNSFRLRMGMTLGLMPQVSSDFMKLDGTPGTTLAFETTAFNAHDHCAGTAQLGASRDLWVFWGPNEAEWGAQDSTFTTRLRVSPSGPHTWSVGTPIPMVGSGAISSPEFLCVTGSTNFVWFMYFDPADGLSIDRVAADGSYTHSAAPSPDSRIDRNGWGVFSVSPDESRIYAIWSSFSRYADDASTRQGAWDGTTWTLFSDPLAGDAWGFAGSTGWGEGVVAMRMADADYAIAVSVIRTD
ncbi:MAG: chitobiase/beta-hexosaminidase C-terminal domain-containing protein, partial [Acidobacteria bacterium]|nr:chitobiase/beta-hexosaminidase C-terminal domain-containing protein [Acidobacteriota bacterium]